jgi:hypothetical protein
MDNPSSVQHEAEHTSTQGSRPRSLWVLMALAGVTSLFGWLWPLFLPTLPVRASQPFIGLREVPMVLVIYVCSLVDLVVAGGLWRQKLWAFRVGLIITVFAIAFDLFVLLVSVSQAVLAVGALLALLLNSLILSLFLQPGVIRTVIAWKQKG